MIRSIWREFVSCFVREDGVGEVSEFFRDGLKPSFFVAREASDSWIVGSGDSCGPDLGNVVVVFKS